MTTLVLANDQDTIALGKKIALICKDYLYLQDSAITIHLIGDLGAGKTTFCRGFLQQLGHKGNVKSPTYTLVEPYQFNDFFVYHFDLYRLTDPEELEFMGIREYFLSRSICLIEWPEQANGSLPTADIAIHLSYYELERKAQVLAETILGQTIINNIQ